MPHTYGFEEERWPKPLSRLDPIKNALKAKGPTNKQPTICQSGNNNQRHLIRCHWLGVPSLSLCNGGNARIFECIFVIFLSGFSSRLSFFHHLKTRRAWQIWQAWLKMKSWTQKGVRSFVQKKEKGGTRKESLKAHKRDGQRDTNFKFLEEFLDIWKSLSGKQKCRVVWHFQKIQNKIKSEIKKNMSLHRLSTAFDRLVAIGENLCRFFRRHLGYLSNS